MAINFLDNVQFNHNQLLGARIENVTSDPTSANGGDIIFNTTSNTLKYYDGTTPFNAAGWISLPDGMGIGGSGTVGTIPVFNSTTEITDSRLEVTGSGGTQSFLFNSTGDFATKGNLDPDGGIKDKDGQLGTSGQLLSSTGTQVDWIDAPVSYTKWITIGAAASTQDVNDGDTYSLVESTVGPGIFADPVTKSGTTITQPLSLFLKNLTVAAPSAYSTDVLLWGTNTSPWKAQQTHIDDIPVSAWGQAQATVDMGDNFIIKVLDPVNAQDAATKAYVDSAVAGGLNVKGGFNASTGAIVSGGNLTSGGSRVAIAIGDYYVVTVAGNFFGNAATPLTPGDSVLVQTAAAAGASVEGDFAVIQSDTDLATASTVGIGNVNNSAIQNNEGLSLSYSNGTAVVGFNIKSLSAAASALADGDGFVIYQGSAGVAFERNKSLTASLIPPYVLSKNSFAGNNASSGTSHTFTHNLGTGDVAVQLYDTSTKETVYATVDRTGQNTVVVTTASSIASGAIRALITKVG